MLHALSEAHTDFCISPGILAAISWEGAVFLSPACKWETGVYDVKCSAGVLRLVKGTCEMATETVRSPGLWTTQHWARSSFLVRGRPQFYPLGRVTFRLFVGQHHGVVLNKYQQNKHEGPHHTFKEQTEGPPPATTWVKTPGPCLRTCRPYATPAHGFSVLRFSYKKNLFSSAWLGSEISGLW